MRITKKEKRLNAEIMVPTLLYAAVKNGGATALYSGLKCDLLRYAAFTAGAGFQVGGYSKVITLDKKLALMVIKLLDPVLLNNLVSDLEALAPYKGEALHLGLWVNDEDIIEIELSKHFKDFKEAMSAAAARGQKYIFEWSTGESLPVKIK